LRLLFPYRDKDRIFAGDGADDFGDCRRIDLHRYRGRQAGYRSCYYQAFTSLI
jgi:hypothetical protein